MVIYELTLADNGAKECHLVRRFLPKGVIPQQYWACHPDRHLGLTQANRLLRAEFLPLYAEVVNNTIAFADVHKYLEMFLLHGSESVHKVPMSIANFEQFPGPSRAPGLEFLPLLGFDWALLPASLQFAVSSWRINAGPWNSSGSSCLRPRIKRCCELFYRNLFLAL
jgi:hypothetical protein